ncbi:hypothetical protein LguiA_030118 [Lonicera macranthoides]
MCFITQVEVMLNWVKDIMVIQNAFGLQNPSFHLLSHQTFFFLLSHSLPSSSSPSSSASASGHSK